MGRAVWLRRAKGDTVYEILHAPGIARVTETQEAGEAELECPIPGGCVCIQWNLGTGLFQFLQEEQNADGALFLCLPDGRLEAHIIECKKTVNQTTWVKALKQMRWTLYRLLAIGGVLRIQLHSVVFSTAYRHDGLSDSPNPAATRRPIGPPEEQTAGEHEVNEARREQLA